MTVTEVAALIGALTGPSGLLLAFLVYSRDRAMVEVFAQADMSAFGSMPAVKGATYYVVRITNVGRRGAFVSHTHFAIPKGTVGGVTHVVIGNPQGVTLGEGAPPHYVYINQAGLQAYAHIWWRMRATVHDGAGARYNSPWPIDAPSWANGVKAPLGAISWNRVRNWFGKRVI